MRTVIGYHACPLEYAAALCNGTVPLAEWKPSRNRYDWLGSGIYFWEVSLRRASEWARELKQPAGIIKAEIDLGQCLDLTETEYLQEFQAVYKRLVELYRQKGWRLPANRELDAPRGYRRQLLTILDGINNWLYPLLVQVKFQRRSENKLRFLDALVINEFFELMTVGDEVVFQTVRSPFEEGEPIFPGSMIRAQTHIQIAVRDIRCIQSVELIEGDSNHVA